MRDRRLALTFAGICFAWLTLTFSHGAQGAAQRPGPRRHSDAPRFANGATVTRLPDGRYLEVGGLDEEGRLRGARLIDRVTGEIVEVGGGQDLERTGHSATLLPDGRVAVLGGADASGQLLDSLVLFEPETQAIEVLPASRLLSRADHTATVLADGRVLVMGGSDEARQPTGDALFWDPSTAQVQLAAPPEAGGWARHRHRARLLADGRVALEDWDGGRPQVFDPQTGEFSASQVPAGDPGRIPVLRSIPADGAAGVALEARLGMHLSRPIDASAITAGMVRVEWQDGAHSVKVVAAEGGRLIFVSPRDPWQPSTTYRVVLDGLLDAETHAPYTTQWSFTTLAAEAGEGSPDQPEWSPDTTGQSSGWRMGHGQSSWQSLPPLRAAPGQTAVAGQVLRLDGRPLPGTLLQMAGRLARTDGTGRFLLLLEKTTHGRRTLLIDGRAASSRRGAYGTFEVGLHVTSGRTNPLTFTVWMPRIDTRHDVRISSPATRETVITTPRIPGLELRLPAGSVIRDREGRTVTRVSITPIPVDRPPFPLPKHVSVPIYFTIQPGGAYVYAPGHKPARLIYPNYRHVPAGRRMDFWHYDPPERDWYVYGGGSVSQGANQIVPDAGVGIYQFTGAMVAPPELGPEDGPTGGPYDGEPVHLGTGLFVTSQIDISLPDLIPISLKRVYRPNDSRSRAFGIGSSHPYDVFLTGDTFPYTYIDLFLADGRRVHFSRISPGTGMLDALYEHNESPSVFYKARIAYQSGSWNLTFKNDTLWRFPESPGAVRSQQAALLSITDRYGNALTMTRDAAGDLTRLTTQHGRYVEFSYDGSHRVTGATDNAGRSVGYEYDASGRLWKVTNVNGGVTEYTYDASHRMLTLKDPKGVVYLTNEYDGNGRVIRQTQADASTFEFSYVLDTAGEVVQADVTNPRGFVRRVTFNSAGFSLTDTRALGQAIQQNYARERQAGSNLTTAITDPLGRRTEYEYDSMGNGTGVIELAGTPNAVATHFTYEPTYNQLASVTDALGHQTLLTYDSSGKNLIAVQDPLLRITTMSRDGSGRLTSLTDPLGHTTLYGYAGPECVRLTTPSGHVWHRFFDSAGRLRATRDPLGGVTQGDYDEFAQLTHIVDARGAETTITYDANGNLSSVTDARGHTTTFVVNAMDRLTEIVDPLTRSETYSYDAAGNVTSRTDRESQGSTVSYDALNRPTRVTYHDSTYTDFTWDAGDRATQIASSSSGTVSRTFDGLDRLTDETTPQGTVSYVYDAVNRRTSMTVSGQPAITYAYDDGDRLTGITRGTRAVAFGLDNADRVTSIGLPGGITATYVYDADDNVTDISYALGSSGLGTLTYTYDARGQRVGEGGTFARTLLPSSVASASYDAANQLLSWGGAGLSYDSNGHVTVDGSRQYDWNALGQLSAITGAASATFTYDALGRRTSRTVGGLSTEFLYDGANAVQELRTGVPLANMLTGFGLDEVYERSDAGGNQAFLVDALGSTLALALDTGALQAEYTYSPFGSTSELGASENGTQYAGRENDRTGLYFYRSRFYDPQRQRFLSPDPMGYGGGDTNLYAYVGNNPTGLIDPLGLGPKKPPHPPEGPPPWDLPPGKKGEEPNDWRKLPPREEGKWPRWVPKYPVETPGGKGGQPHAWFDPPDDYWSYEDGAGGRRQHKDQWGNDVPPLPPRGGEGGKGGDRPVPPTPPRAPGIPGIPWWRMPIPLPVAINPCFDPAFMRHCYAPKPCRT